MRHHPSLSPLATTLLAVPALLTVLGVGASAAPLQPASAVLSAGPLQPPASAPSTVAPPRSSGAPPVQVLGAGAPQPGSVATQATLATPQATTSAPIPPALAGTWLSQWGDAAGTMQSSIIKKFAITVNGAYQYVEDHRDVYYARGCVDERQYYESGVSGVQGSSFLRRPSVAYALHQGNCGLGANFGWTPVRLVNSWSYYQIGQARTGQVQLAIINPSNPKDITLFTKE